MTLSELEYAIRNAYHHAERQGIKLTAVYIGFKDMREVRASNRHEWSMSQSAQLNGSIEVMGIHVHRLADLPSYIGFSYEL